MDEILKTVSVDTAMARAQLIVSNAIKNMSAIQTLPYAVGTLQFAGNVCVCGAGPSLDDDVDKLRGSNVIVIAVNGAWKTLEKKGVKVNAVICIESLDVSKQLDGWQGITILDWSTHPNVLEAARKCGPVVWFTDSSPYSIEYMKLYGFIPISVGPSAVTAATDLAFKCGASSVTLVGIDSCYPEDRAYAKDSPWGKLSVRRRGDKLIFPPNPERDKLHIESGVPPVPEVRRRVRVNGMDTTVELYAQLKWFEAYKQQTERDVRIASRYMAQAMDVPQWPKVDRGFVGFYDNGNRAKWLIPLVTTESFAAKEVCKDFSANRFNADMFESNRGLQLIQTLALSDNMRLRRNPNAKRQAKLTGTYSIMSAAADIALELIQWTRGRIDQMNESANDAHS